MNVMVVLGRVPCLPVMDCHYDVVLLKSEFLSTTAATMEGKTVMVVTMGEM